MEIFSCHCTRECRDPAISIYGMPSEMLIVIIALFTTVQSSIRIVISTDRNETLFIVRHIMLGANAYFLVRAVFY